MNSHVAKHLIIAAYYFPPLGLAGTHRPLAMANFFAERGYRVTVLTVKPIDYPAYDESLLNQLDKRVNVVRAGSGDPARLRRLIPMIPRSSTLKGGIKDAAVSALFPDSKVGFVRPAGRLLEKLLRSDTENLLITTSPPVSIHQIGLNCRSGITKWVADFRDIWQSTSYDQGDPAYRSRAVAYLQEVLSSCDLVSATSPLSLEHFRSALGAAVRAYLLPNGYEESDFVSCVRPVPNSVGLYGTINRLVGIERVLEWFSLYVRATGNGMLHLRHVGHLDYPAVRDLLPRFGLRDRFLSTGFLPHSQAVAEMRAHSVNLISLTDELDTSFIVPSKLFEMLRAEPPLIAILPKENAARSLLEHNNFERVAIVEDGRSFMGALDKFLSDEERSVRSGIKGFERAKQMAGFATELEKL